jgi:hypothetical protein
MSEKKPYIPVSQEQLIHDLAIAWLIRDKKEYRSAKDFADEYLQLIQAFESAVDHATNYDFNPTPKADI